jgi:glycosyltransferase involved in cell wall biosynthesis
MGKIIMLDLLFLGGLYPKELETEINSKVIDQAQYAANNFQWLLIDGFDKDPEVSLYILNEMFLGSYPKHYKDAVIKESKFSHKPGAIDINLGFINTTIIKHFLPAFKGQKYIKLWAKENAKNSPKAVFIYSMNPKFIKRVKLIKKYNSSIPICISVNDIIEFTMMDSRKKLLTYLWKYMQSYRIRKVQKKLDCYMLVSKKMADYLHLDPKQYVVVESLMAVHNNFSKKNESEEKLRYVAYTGGLARKYGITNLLDAFMSIEDPNYRLIICGAGESKEDIIKCKQIDKRIDFLGLVTPEKARVIQESATVLVNPRQDLYEYTSLSFPHKTMEYLSAGKPVICYKLGGIPDEYDNYLIYVKDNSIKALADKIIETCEKTKSERILIGEQNMEFVLEQKNTFVQTQKIIRLIKEHIENTNTVNMGNSIADSN